MRSYVRRIVVRPRPAARWLRENQFRLFGFLWILLAIPTLLWWKESVLWVALMSLYANSVTAFGAHEARRARRASEVEPL